MKGIEPFAQTNNDGAEVEGCTQNCQHPAVPSLEIEPRLYDILTSWNTLAAPIKDAIYALVKSQKGGEA